LHIAPTSFLEAGGNRSSGGRPDSSPERITVAGQRRTFTGFAFKPSHPGGRAPDLHLYSIDAVIVQQDCRVEKNVTRRTDC
jgi:hypothetical protein